MVHAPLMRIIIDHISIRYIIDYVHIQKFGVILSPHDDSYVSNPSL